MHVADVSKYPSNVMKLTDKVCAKQNRHSGNLLHLVNKIPNQLPYISRKYQAA